MEQDLVSGGDLGRWGWREGPPGERGRCCVLECPEGDWSRLGGDRVSRASLAAM